MAHRRVPRPVRRVLPLDVVERANQVLDAPRILARYPRRFDLAVTDSGLGDTAVLISWNPRHPLPWPFASEGRNATRLCRCIQQNLDAVQAPAQL